MTKIVDGHKAELEAAVKLLSELTAGKIYLSVGKDWTMGNIAGAEMVTVEGPHPSGNVGVQIANIAPINKGDIVWTLDVVTLYKIGVVATKGIVDCSTIVAVTGSEVKEPALVKTVEGAQISSIIGGRLAKTDHHVRIISGNVLTGTAVDDNDYLRFPYRQITVIPEATMWKNSWAGHRCRPRSKAQAALSPATSWAAHSPPTPASSADAAQ